MIDRMYVFLHEIKEYNQSFLMMNSLRRKLILNLKRRQFIIFQSYELNFSRNQI